MDAGKCPLNDPSPMLSLPPWAPLPGPVLITGKKAVGGTSQWGTIDGGTRCREDRRTKNVTSTDVPDAKI